MRHWAREGLWLFWPLPLLTIHRCPRGSLLLRHIPKLCQFGIHLLRNIFLAFRLPMSTPLLKMMRVNVVSLKVIRLFCGFLQLFLFFRDFLEICRLWYQERCAKYTQRFASRLLPFTKRWCWIPGTVPVQRNESRKDVGWVPLLYSIE